MVIFEKTLAGSCILEVKVVQCLLWGKTECRWS